MTWLKAHLAEAETPGPAVKRNSLMKTLGKIDEIKGACTAKASDVFRQLAFAGFAVVWILRETSGQVSQDLAPAAAMFALTLLLDAMQYAIGSLIWIVFYNHHYEKTLSDDAKVDIPGAINWPTYFCFWAKMVAIAIGWSLLADQLIKKWHWPSL